MRPVLSVLSRDIQWLSRFFKKPLAWLKLSPLIAGFTFALFWDFGLFTAVYATSVVTLCLIARFIFCSCHYKEHCRRVIRWREFKQTMTAH